MGEAEGQEADIRREPGEQARGPQQGPLGNRPTRCMPEEEVRDPWGTALGTAIIQEQAAPVGEAAATAIPREAPERQTPEAGEAVLDVRKTAWMSARQGPGEQEAPG